METLCDGNDNDCNGTIDGPGICPPVNYYCDDDNDGFFDINIDGTCTTFNCVPAGCQNTSGNDCNDSNQAVHPNAVEICDDSIDNDCDGDIDMDDSYCSCNDNDNDGFNGTSPNCPGGTDCDDDIAGDPAGCPPVPGGCNAGTTLCAICIHPGAQEYCDDGVDNDCNGQTDFNPDTYCTTTCTDVDGDNWYATCNLLNPDCDDGDEDRFPGNPEVCDGKDNDCDLIVPLDEQDNDGDGFAECEGDCDDGDINKYPGQGCGPSILVVDDDTGGTDYGATRNANLFQAAIVGYNSYGVTIIKTSDGLPTLLQLQDYDAVIWSCSDLRDPINGSEATLLQDYVAGGGRLMLEGWGVGYYQYDNPGVGWYNTFMDDVVRGEAYDRESPTLPKYIRTKEGQTTHPITATLSWCKVLISADTTTIVHMHTANGGEETFNQGEGFGDDIKCYNEGGYVGGGPTLGITYSGGGAKTFYLSIAIDGIPDTNNERRDLMRNTADWLVA
ncbi:MAG: hypothetical protein A7315_08660 [Candidatus Altiarchaeales archaeon WOR_SM1_79]|nr:MAG: hypothetical protein A7315_08660 [Candidatus Altiarchaeales archaeon WOR_SM1_79]